MFLEEKLRNASSVNTCGLNHLGPRHIQKDHLLCMVRHGTLGTQACPVVCNGCIDKLLGNIVIVPGTWTTFVFSELLCLDNGCLWIVFFNGFPLPLGTHIAANMTSEGFVWMKARWSH